MRQGARQEGATGHERRTEAAFVPKAHSTFIRPRPREMFARGIVVGTARRPCPGQSAWGRIGELVGRSG